MRAVMDAFLVLAGIGVAIIAGVGAAYLSKHRHDAPTVIERTALVPAFQQETCTLANIGPDMSVSFDWPCVERTADEAARSRHPSMYGSVAIIARAARDEGRRQPR